MCSSRKNPYHTHGRSLEIPRGRGLLKVKLFEAKCEVKLEFPGGEGVQNIKPSMGEYGYFLELHNVSFSERFPEKPSRFHSNAGHYKEFK